MSKKVCIITTGTITSNPRVVKEAAALSEAGYQVHLIYTRHVDYLLKADQEILESHPEWTSDYLDWAGVDFRSRSIKLITGIKRRVANFILKTGFYPLMSAGYLINRFYYWQLNKAILCKADLYIAHYPDSIAIAAKAAKLNHALFAFDAEDFHRGEYIPIEVTTAISRIEDRYLQSAAYISAASPLITQTYQRLYPRVYVFCLQNMFPIKSQPPFQNLIETTVKFFWFSQTIGPKRGLEEFIAVLKLTGKKNTQLTLLGNASPDYKAQLQEQWIESGLEAKFLNFVMPLPEKDIFVLAGNHHFGLGLEIPYSVNRDICLTNKIFTYILSGNILILSLTKAQKHFHDAYPKTGICIDLENPKDAARKLLKLMDDRESLNVIRRHNYHLGSNSLNFDREKEILLKLVDNLLK